MVRRIWFFVLLAPACLVTGCTYPPDETPERLIEERLVGTWLREYSEDTSQVRRVLVLARDGTFSEKAVVHGPAPAQFSHSGDWRFDGTNLKRHYRLLDGKPPTAPFVPFATFELKFQTPDEFSGLDRVHRREVHYRRVTDGTLP